MRVIGCLNPIYKCTMKVKVAKFGYCGGIPSFFLKKVGCTIDRPFTCERFEFEHICRDPKDGELCLVVFESRLLRGTVGV